MDENRKGPGVFYSVIGVATLLVAIIGATFAFFTATQSNDEVIQGEAATAGVSLTVTKVSTDATGSLIPIADGTSGVDGFNSNLLGSALVGTDDKVCVDSDGNTVCQLYKIAVTNDGTAGASFDGSLELTVTGEGSYKNLRWANINDNSGLTKDVQPTAPGEALKNMTDTEITSNEFYTGGQIKYYYVLIYIAEKGSAQNTEDKGSFTGKVTFQSAGGHGATATFSA